MSNQPVLSLLSLFLLLLVAVAPGSAQAWPPSLPDVTGYPRPVPVNAVTRAAEIPRLVLNPGGVEAREAVANEAVRVSVTAAAVQPDLFGERAPEGQSFLILATRWENIHPRELVDRASLEGRADRTMGVGAFSGGGGGRTEYVEADVAYQVPRLLDHIYALVDGAAVSLHSATGILPGGADPEGGLHLPALGSVKTLALAFLVPGEPRDLALQFFDYNYGNVLVSVLGDAGRAGDVAAVAGEDLDRVETDVLEVSATGLSFRNRYDGQQAPAGWRYAVVSLQGQSRSEGGGMGNIVQLNPLEYAFLLTDGGYLRYAAGGSVDHAGVIRFTPEVPQRQELAFLVPLEDEAMTLGLRLRNEVVTLSLTDKDPEGLPRRERATHADGDVLEVVLFGGRREGGAWIVDLGLRPEVEGQGLEIQVGAQFLLLTPEGEIVPDLSASAARSGRPPEPFIVPPGTAVRFELVFPVTGDAEGIRYRGFRSEGILRF